MKIELNAFTPADELSIDTELVKKRLSEAEELVVVEHNTPQFIILSTEKYNALTAHTPPVPKAARTSAANDQIKIGKLIQDSFRKLFYRGNLPDSEIENLLQAEYSNRVFALNFPVLKKYDPALPFDQQKRDANGYNRFYQFTLVRGSDQYLLCSQWIEKLHRENFEKWLEQWENK